MPSPEEEQFIASMKEDGVTDWMERQIEQGLHHTTPEGEEPPTTVETPPDADAGLAAEETETEAPAVAAEEVETEEQPEVSETTEETPPEDDEGLFLEMTPEVEKFIADSGGLNEALAKGLWADTVRGRQGNELGEVRAELARIREQLAQPQPQPLQPYPAWPDMDDEPEAVVPQLTRIADQAFAQQDLQAFAGAVEAWQEVDALGANAYKMLKRTELSLLDQQARPAPVVPEQGPDLRARMEAVTAKYPQLESDDFKVALGAEIAALPPLRQRILQGEVPGVTPEDRVAEFESLVRKVASRQTDDQVQQAARRVAVRTSEEARQARAAAQVAASTSRGDTAEKEAGRVIPMLGVKEGFSVDKLDAEIERRTRHTTPEIIYDGQGNRID